MATPINTIEDFRTAINHPYRSGEYLTDGTSIFQVPDNEEEVICLIDSYEGEADALTYDVNWEDQNMFDEIGNQIKPVY